MKRIAFVSCRKASQLQIRLIPHSVWLLILKKRLESQNETRV